MTGIRVSGVLLVSLLLAGGVAAQEEAIVEVPEGVVPVIDSAATASVLRLIRFSGTVPGAQGQAAGITFALYADQEGGAPLWLETQNVSLDHQGRYTVLLGATQTEGLPLGLFTLGEARWLGIQVQGQAEHTRVLLVSVPYALRAEEAQRLAGREASEYLLAEQMESEVRQVVETKVVEEMEVQGLVSTEEGVTRTITDGASTFTDNNTTQVVQVTQNGTGKGLKAVSTTGNTVDAESTGTSGTNFTLLGINRSTGGRALFGFAAATSGNTIAAAGRNDSTAGIGFFGQAFATSGQTVAVQGEVRSPSGIAGVFVNTAGGPLLEGRSQGQLVFSVDGNGNIETDGDVTATAFFGDGSNLTGIGGGSGWSLTGNAGTTAGTNFVGTTDDVALELHVNSTRALRIEPTAGAPNVIGGLSGNSVTSGAFAATIGGGGSSGNINQVTATGGTVGGGINNLAGAPSAFHATVGGGNGNTASGAVSTVGGGVSNTASGTQSTVGGGQGNTASEQSSTVAGGQTNTASGLWATVGGGIGNTASNEKSTVGGGDSNLASGVSSTVPGGAFSWATGNTSFAAGTRAKANHDGAFVWGDSTNTDFASERADQFRVRAGGGARFDVTGNDFVDIRDDTTNLINTSTGAVLTVGGVWTDSSDAALKENFAPADPDEVLARLAEVPVQRWNYKAEGPDVHRLGPTAQDFYAAFGLGTDDKHIGSVDAHGVAFAAIQALYRQLQERERQLQAQGEQIQQQEAVLQQLQAELALVKSALIGSDDNQLAALKSQE